ncbi:MAG: phosphonoacetate hydrolase [Terracidiphilus sp.]
MITVNNRNYGTRTLPVVAICLDGTDPSYLAAAARVMPRLEAIGTKGARGLAESQIPSLTNPNNVAIVTGAPASVNGICGNYYYDATRGGEVMMDDPEYLRCPTILAAFSQAGYAAGAISAKDKLRRLLGKNLRGVCFSIEQIDKATPAENGIERVEEIVGRPAPHIYDPEISVYCIEAGVRLLEQRKFDLLYLSTTDFVQHKYKPGSPEADGFYSQIDRLLGKLDETGAVIGVTADHGMNDKVKQDGSPRVQFLESFLKERGFAEARVILPITDPHIVHHGALGSYATVYLRGEHVPEAMRMIETVAGIERVLSREQAALEFCLPPDRIGDLVVLSDESTVLGRTPEWHNLSHVGNGLRSHGGLHERSVPFVVNRPLKREYAQRLQSGKVKNYDLLDFLFNGTED